MTGQRTFLLSAKRAIMKEIRSCAPEKKVNKGDETTFWEGVAGLFSYTLNSTPKKEFWYKKYFGDSFLFESVII